MDPNTSYNPYRSEDAGADSKLVDRAAESADHAIESTQDMAKGVLARVADKAAAARDSAGPAIDELAGRLKGVARAGADTVRDTTTQAREAALRASDVAATYVRQEPLKAMLMAAAAGAALMVLVSLLGRSRE